MPDSLESDDSGLHLFVGFDGESIHKGLHILVYPAFEQRFCYFVREFLLLFVVLSLLHDLDAVLLGVGVRGGLFCLLTHLVARLSHLFLQGLLHIQLLFLGDLRNEKFTRLALFHRVTEGDWVFACHCFCLLLYQNLCLKLRFFSLLFVHFELFTIVHSIILGLFIRD